MVRTDHYAVKFMLDQRLSTIPQHHWISKLFGFDFSVEFRPGKLNTVADTLSRRDSTQGLLALISGPTFSFPVRNSEVMSTRLTILMFLVARIIFSKSICKKYGFNRLFSNIKDERTKL